MIEMQGDATGYWMRFELWTLLFSCQELFFFAVVAAPQQAMIGYYDVLVTFVIILLYWLLNYWPP